MEIIEIFQQGGFAMYLLLIASICAIAILVERLRFYKKALSGVEVYLDNLEENLSKMSWEEIFDKSSKHVNVSSAMVNAVAKAEMSGYDVELSLDRSYTTLASQLRKSLNYLSAIVTLSPLLGLLGTIFGMISSFQIFNLKAGQPMAITGGIGEALIATAFGLGVAVFSLVVHTYFVSRMDYALTIMEKTGAILLSEVRKRG